MNDTQFATLLTLPHKYLIHILKRRGLVPMSTDCIVILQNTKFAHSKPLKWKKIQKFNINKKQTNNSTEPDHLSQKQSTFKLTHKHIIYLSCWTYFGIYIPSEMGNLI